MGYLTRECAQHPPTLAKVPEDPFWSLALPCVAAALAVLAGRRSVRGAGVPPGGLAARALERRSLARPSRARSRAVPARSAPWPGRQAATSGLPRSTACSSATTSSSTSTPCRPWQGAPRGAPVGLVLEDEHRLWLATEAEFGCVDLRQFFGRTFASSDGLPPPPYRSLRRGATGELVLEADGASFRYWPGRDGAPECRVVSLSGLPFVAGERVALASGEIELEVVMSGGAELRWLELCIPTGTWSRARRRRSPGSSPDATTWRWSPSTATWRRRRRWSCRSRFPIRGCERPPPGDARGPGRAARAGRLRCPGLAPPRRTDAAGWRR